MATITSKENKDGELYAFKILVCLGRDSHYRQTWRSETIRLDDPRIVGLTPTKRAKELEVIAHELEKKWKMEFRDSPGTAKQKSKKYALSQLFDIWMQNNQTNWKPQTALEFKSKIRVMNDFFGSKIKITEIDRLQLDSLLKYLREVKRYRDRTVEGTLLVLRLALEYAVDIGALKNNPLKGFKIKHLDEKPDSVDFLSPEETITFLQVLAEETERTGSMGWEVFGNIALFLGLRSSEICGLKWGDYDAVNATLAVKRSISKDEKGGCIVSTTKMRRWRVLPVPAGLADMLNRYHEEQTALYGESDDYFLFHAQKEGPMRHLHSATPAGWMAAAKKRYPQLPERVHWHLCRHTNATLILASGSDLSTAQAILGHADIGMTRRFYAATLETSIRNAVNGLETMIYGQIGNKDKE